MGDDVDHLIGIIGGTGLGDALAAKLQDVETKEVDTPFGKPSGPVLLGKLGSHRFAFLSRHGAGHPYGPGVVPYAANIFALKSLGVTALIASGAVGSLQQEISPGHIVVVDQFIDKTYRRQNTFFDKLGAVYCEFAQPCCHRLREQLLKVSKEIETPTHEKGTYVCMEGPQFSTRAESLMHRQWGADLIGMTAMPEAKLAREAQMCYALVALVSDYDCWREHDPSIGQQALLEEIIGNLNSASHNAITLIEKLLDSDLKLCDNSCTCRKSLNLAVWSKPEAVDQKEKETLAPLFE
jgi:5'-methylthioadenosine phosphorylase